MFKVIEVDFDGFGRLTFGEQRPQLSHGYSIVLGIIERKVADLLRVRQMYE